MQRRSDVSRIAPEALFGQPRSGPDDEAAFEELYAQLGIVERLDARGIRPSLVPVTLPVALFLSGVAVSAYYDQLGTYVTSGSSLVVCFNFAVFLATVLWADHRGPSVVADIRDVFDVDDDRYYGFFGRLVTRLYEPFPWTGGPDGTGQWFHAPTAVAFAGLTALLFVLAKVTPLMTLLTRTNWSSLPTGFKAFLLFQFLVPIGASVLVAWVVVVLLVFMGVRARSLDVRLDPTRAESHLGLEPYSRLALRMGYASLLLLTTSGVFVIQAPEPSMLLAYGYLSILPLVGVVGGNYGLHRAILQAKRRRFAHLRETYADELEHWFFGTADEVEPDRSIEEFLEVKREIEALPDWPFDVQRFVELLLLAVVSNLSVFYNLVAS